MYWATALNKRHDCHIHPTPYGVCIFQPTVAGPPVPGGGGGVLNKVLYGEGPPRGPNPHPFIYHF